MHIRVGTRGSKLALTQTRLVIDELKRHYPEDSFEEVVIKTTGDKIQDKALDEIGSKGLFVDEIESRLLEGDIQLAVHSMKDMPDTLMEGLIFSKPLTREDPRDVLILREAASLEELGPNPIIATGSARRSLQVKALRQDVEIVGIRGNIDTRLRKLHEPMADGRYIDGIILAAAGLHRLGLQDEISQYFSIEEMIPAPTQGILALELREDNTELLNKINAISDPDTARAAEIEREFLMKSGGDCHNPVGAYYDKQTNILHGYTGSYDGREINITRQEYRS